MGVVLSKSKGKSGPGKGYKECPHCDEPMPTRSQICPNPKCQHTLSPKGQSQHVVRQSNDAFQIDDIEAVKSLTNRLGADTVSRLAGVLGK